MVDRSVHSPGCNAMQTFIPSSYNFDAYQFAEYSAG
jgi:hypothetical protein